MLVVGAVSLFSLYYAMGKKTVLIIGANGQDASYMAEFLIEKGYKVHVLLEETLYQNHKQIE